MTRPTIRHVAALAQVSLGTVSRVINGHPLVREAKRDRVLEAMKALDFQPSAAARTMRMRATKVIGCMITDITHPLVNAMVSAAEQTLRGAGYATVVASSGEQPEQELRLLQFFRQRQVDALIAQITRENHRAVVRALRGLTMPVMLYERQLGSQFDSVHMDHGGACYQAARYLIGLGHRRIALITGAADSFPGRSRSEMLAFAMNEAKLPFSSSWVRRIKATVAEGYREAEALLCSDDRPTAIIAGAYELTGVLKAVRHLELEVPRDVSLIALGDSDLTELASPSITTLRFDVAESGRLLATLLLGRLGDELPAPGQDISLPPLLIERESCAPPPTGRGPNRSIVV